MAGLAYIVCAATSLACALLLSRAYRRQRVKLVLWSACCFAGLTLENALLYVDRVVVPNVDLSTYRLSVGLAALALLVWGLIWDAK